MKIKRRIASDGWHARLRPSPAMLVAVAALFVALGSVGYAATTIGSEEIRNNSLQSVDVKNDDLLSRDIHDGTILSRDVTDDTLLSRDVQDDTVLSRDIHDGTILEKDVAPAALEALGAPRAFASVNGNVASGGSLVDGDDSEGISGRNVSNPAVGVYCFSDLGFVPRIAIATFASTSVFTTSEDVVLRASVGLPLNPLCPVSLGSASVTLVRRDNGAPINGRFYVMFE